MNVPNIMGMTQIPPKEVISNVAKPPDKVIEMVALQTELSKLLGKNLVVLSTLGSSCIVFKDRKNTIAVKASKAAEGNGWGIVDNPNYEEIVEEMEADSSPGNIAKCQAELVGLVEERKTQMFQAFTREISNLIRLSNVGACVGYKSHMLPSKEQDRYVIEMELLAKQDIRTAPLYLVKSEIRRLAEACVELNLLPADVEIVYNGKSIRFLDVGAFSKKEGQSVEEVENLLINGYLAPDVAAKILPATSSSAKNN